MSVDRYTHPAATGSAALAADAPAARLSVRRVSWGAVLAGVIIALAVQLLLSLLGLGVGASTIDPMQGDTPGAQTLGIGAGIWWLVSSLIAVFAGGWVAGRLAGVPERTDGMLHGLVTWGLAMLLMLYLLTTTISGLIGGAFGMIGSALQAAGQGAAATAQTAQQTPQGQGALGQIQGQIQQMLNQYAQQMSQAGQQIQQAAQDEQVRRVLERAVTAGPDALTPADREAAVSALQEHAGLSRTEAEQQLNQWIQSYREAQQTATQVGEQTADAVSQASLWSFAALAIGAVVAAIGGMLGAPKRVRVEA